MIETVQPDTLAEALGLQRGDIVTKIAGHSIGSAQDVQKVLSAIDAGATVEVTFLRKGAETAKGAYATTPSGLEPLVAILRPEMREQLLQQLDLPRTPRTHAALDAAGAIQVAFADTGPFGNINTPTDLERLSPPDR